MYLLYITWTDPAHDETLHKAADATINEIKATGVKSGTGNPYVYLNYAGEHQEVLGGYGAANMQMMRDLSAKYDPNGVFQNLVPGGWKIKSATPITS